MNGDTVLDLGYVKLHYVCPTQRSRAHRENFRAIGRWRSWREGWRRFGLLGGVILRGQFWKSILGRELRGR